MIYPLASFWSLSSSFSSYSSSPSSLWELSSQLHALPSHPSRHLFVSLALLCRTLVLWCVYAFLPKFLVSAQDSIVFQVSYLNLCFVDHVPSSLLDVQSGLDLLVYHFQPWDSLLGGHWRSVTCVVVVKVFHLLIWWFFSCKTRF